MAGIVAAAALAAMPLTAGAVGPARVATLDRGTYPGAIDTPARFDQASRLEVMAFAQAVAAADPAAATPEAKASIAKWRERTIKLLRENFAQAQKTCASEAELLCDAPIDGGVETFVERAKAFDRALPASLAGWYAAARPFYTTYVGEQRRLAQSFPVISSEIDTYDADEHTGAELPDRAFQLTFDDGPTTKGGNTDDLLPFLSAQGQHAYFFVLGDRLQARLAGQSPEALRALYAGQCPASHGKTHDSHQNMADWKGSLTYTHDLLAKTFPDAASINVFRPPYGQRVPETAAFVRRWGGHVQLWNLDSQDWSRKMPAAAVPDRMITLMLAWRRGVFLFHDIHPKALSALPKILDATAGSGITWMDCRAPAGVRHP